MRKGKKLLVAFLSLCVMAFTGCLPKNVKYTVVIEGDAQEVSFGDRVLKPDLTPTKAPTVDKVYTFDGWYVADKNGKITDKKWDFETNIVTKDTIIVAKFIESVRKYNVTFKNEDGTEISSAEIDYGTTITAPTAPTKAEDDRYTYEFAGWEGYADGMTVAGDVEFTATFNAILKTSTKEVVIKTEQLDGTYAQDSTSYTYEGYADPTQDQMNALIDAPVGYTGTAKYEDGKIVITYVLNVYTVKFYNADGNECGNLKYKHGANLIVPEDPTYNAGGEYAHTFLGWTLVEGGELVKLPSTVTGSAVYYAKFDGNFAIALPENQVGYTLTSDKEEAEQGETVTLNLILDAGYSDSNVIVKHNDIELEGNDGVYTFIASGVNTITVEGVELNTYAVSVEESSIYNVELSAWDSNANAFVPVDLSNVKHGTEIKAVFTVDRKYVRNDSIIKAYAKGEIIKDFMSLGDGTYLATYIVNGACEFSMNDEDWLCYILTVTYKNEDGSVLDTIEFDRGDEIPLTAKIPTKDADAQYTYTFESWAGLTDGMTSIEDVTFTPVFSATVNKYTVTFMNGADIFGAVDFDYNATVTAPTGTPAKADDGETYFTFKGWATSDGGEVVNLNEQIVKGDATYYAVYDSALHTYSITLPATQTGYSINADKEFAIKGATVTLTLTIEEGYSFSAPVVKLNGVDLVGNDGVYTFATTGAGGVGENLITVEDVVLNTYALNTTNGTGYTVEVGGSNVYGETQTITLTIAKNYVDDLSGIVITVGETEYTELDWVEGDGGVKIATISLVNGTAITEKETSVQITGLKINTASATVSYYLESLDTGYVYDSTIDVTATDNGAGLDIGIADYIGANAKEFAGFTYKEYKYEIGQAEAKIYYTRNSYNVTFYDAEGAEIAGYGSMKYGASIVAPADPIKADDGETYYTFVGWALSADGDVVDVLSTVPVDGIAYYPVYNANVYTYSVALPSEQVVYTLTATEANTQADVITFTFTLTEEDWNTENLKITIAGQDKTAQLLGNGTLAITPADLGLTKGGAINVTVEGLKYNEYTITLPAEQEGYTLTADKPIAIKGATVTLNLALKEGYTNSPVVVKVNTEEITGENGIYSFILAGDTEITVEGIELNIYALTAKESANYGFGLFVEDENGAYAFGDKKYNVLADPSSIVHGTEIIVAFTVNTEYAHIAPKVYDGETELTGFTPIEGEEGRYAVKYTVTKSCELSIDDSNWNAQEYSVSKAQSDKYSVKLYAYNKNTEDFEEIEDTTAIVKAGTILRVEFTVNGEYSNVTPVMYMNSVELEPDSIAGNTYTDTIIVSSDSTFSMNDTEWNLNTFALSAPASDMYSVQFFNAEDEEIVDTSSVEYGSVITVKYTIKTAYTQNSTLIALANGSVITLDEDLKATITVNEDVVFGADTSSWAINKYTVTFKNEDGSEYSSETLDYGTVIALPETEPTKDATAQYTYTFAGWDGYTAGMTATADVEFIATFSDNVNSYTVTFKNEDGSAFSSESFAYGALIALPEAEPTKDATAQYTYTFAGWAGYQEGATVTGNVEYTATFSSTVNSYALTVAQSDKYSVSLLKFNGESYEAVTDTSALIYGTEIKAVFTLNNVDTQTATIKAYVNGEQIGLLACSSTKYVATIIVEGTSAISMNDSDWGLTEFVITFKNEDGSVISSDTIEYGAEIIAPAAPEKEADAQYTYTFVGWDGYNAGMTVTGAAEFTAIFTKTINSYTVTFKNGEEIIKSETLDFGATIVAPEAPSKAGNDQYSYEFAGWTGYEEGATVTGNVEFTATFEEVVNKYNVVIGDNEAVKYAYGSKIEKPEDPTKAEDDDYTYEFIGWYNGDVKWNFDTDTVTADVTLVAKFDEVSKKATVSVSYDIDGHGAEEGYTLPASATFVFTADGKSDTYTFTAGQAQDVKLLIGQTYTVTCTAGETSTIAFNTKTIIVTEDMGSLELVFDYVPFGNVKTQGYELIDYKWKPDAQASSDGAYSYAYDEDDNYSVTYSSNNTNTKLVFTRYQTTTQIENGQMLEFTLKFNEGYGNSVDGSGSVEKIDRLSITIEEDMDVLNEDLMRFNLADGQASPDDKLNGDDESYKAKAESNTSPFGRMLDLVKTGDFSNEYKFGLVRYDNVVYLFGYSEENDKWVSIMRNSTRGEEGAITFGIILRQANVKADHNYTLKNFALSSVSESLLLEANATFVGKETKYDVVIGDNEAVQYAHGTKIEKPEDPIKESDGEYNYIFDAWYVADAEGNATSTKWNFDTDVVKGNVTLVANFTQVEIAKKEVAISATYNNGTEDVNIDGARLVIKKDGADVETVALTNGAATVSLYEGDYTYELDWTDWTASETGDLTVTEEGTTLNIKPAYIQWGAPKDNATGWTRSYDAATDNYTVTYESSARGYYTLARKLADGEMISYRMTFLDKHAKENGTGANIADSMSSIVSNTVGDIANNLTRLVGMQSDGGGYYGDTAVTGATGVRANTNLKVALSFGVYYSIDFAWLRRGNTVYFMSKGSNTDEYVSVSAHSLKSGIATTTPIDIKLSLHPASGYFNYSYSNFKVEKFSSEESEKLKTNASWSNKDNYYSGYNRRISEANADGYVYAGADNAGGILDETFTSATDKVTVSAHVDTKASDGTDVFRGLSIASPTGQLLQIGVYDDRIYITTQNKEALGTRVNYADAGINIKGTTTAFDISVTYWFANSDSCDKSKQHIMANVSINGVEKISALDVTALLESLTDDANNQFSWETDNATVPTGDNFKVGVSMWGIGTSQSAAFSKIKVTKETIAE